MNLDLELAEDVVKSVVDLRPGAAEFVLTRLRAKIDVALSQVRPPLALVPRE